VKKELIELRINGRSHELAIEPSAVLLDVLRQDLQLTGSKRACDDSSCGACTVLVDGVAMMSCTLLAVSCEGQEITTIEGVSEHGSLAAIQKAYGDWGGAQCGYCTPRFIMTVKSLLAENPDPSEDDVRAALSSNLCRCTGYNQMYEAIRSAVEAEKTETLLTRWPDIFVADGSLRDIWVFGVGRSDLQALLEWLNSKYPITYSSYSEGSLQTTLPNLEMVFAQHANDPHFLRVDLGKFAVNIHFFSCEDFEMDVRPEDIDSAEKAESIFRLMSEIGRFLKKEVILAPEWANSTPDELRAMALCSASPTGSLSFHKTHAQVIY
jgi:aerobic-type carbon monoxide dehydrogenase small subunit (CoxS/CutS family)